MAEPGRPPAACTIIARNYLAFARVLGRSYLEHHPGSRFYVLVVDGQTDDLPAGDGLTVLSPDVLKLPYFFELCFKYDVTSLCTAVKPTLLARLLDDFGEREVFYFDPDILIERRLEEAIAALDRANILLTPHLLEPIPLDGYKPSEQEILVSGAFNLGFIGVRAGETTAEFLAWWSSRLRENCRIDPCQGLFVDQKWINLVPGLFPDTVILRDLTYNVAYWNIHARELAARGGTYWVGARPLAFFHYSGFSPLRPTELSRHQNRTQVTSGSVLADLLGRYAERVLAAGHANSIKLAYGYGRFDNGMVIDQILRELYLNLDEPARQQLGNPFQIGGDGGFLDWATRPRRQDANLSLFLLRLHGLRPDVAAAFPDVRGSHRDGFVRWAREIGPREMGYDPRLVRPAERGQGGRSKRLEAELAHDPADVDAAVQYGRAPVVPPIDVRHSRYGPLGRLIKQAFARVMRYQTHHQQQVNYNFAAFMREMSAAQDAQLERLNEIDRRLQAVELGPGAPSEPGRAARQDRAGTEG